MNLLDIGIIVVVALSVVGGFREGFARSCIGFVASLVGIFAGFWYAHRVGAYLVRFTSSNVLADIFGFFLVLAGFVVLGSLIGLLLATVFRWVGISWLDRMAGGLFGFARGVLVAVGMLTIYLAVAPNPPPRAITHSRFAPYLMDASDVVATVIPHQMRQAFHATTNRVRRLWSEQETSGRSDTHEEAAHI